MPSTTIQPLSAVAPRFLRALTTAHPELLTGEAVSGADVTQTVSEHMSTLEQESPWVFAWLVAQLPGLVDGDTEVDGAALIDWLAREVHPESAATV